MGWQKSEWYGELGRLLSEIRKAKLVGCVRGKLTLGVNCPIFEFCPFAPKRDIQEEILQINRPTILFDFEPEKALEIVREGFKLLEEAKEISRNCPMKNLVLREPLPE